MTSPDSARAGCTGGRLSLLPVTLADANAFVTANHRHHKKVVGHKFSLAAVAGEKIVGVAIIGRPVARGRDDGLTLEVTRLCTDGIERKIFDKNGSEHSLGICSFLYGAAARATFALGYKRLGTYILASEPGTSLTAAGWRLIGEVKGRSWSCQSRPRIDKHPTQDKLLYEARP